MSYDFKIVSMEVYKSDSLVPKIAADVMAYSDEGALLLHKTVIVPAADIDKAVVSKDTVEKATSKVVAQMVLADPLLSTEYLDKLDAEQKAREASWAEAQVVVDKVTVKIGLSPAPEEEKITTLLR